MFSPEARIFNNGHLGILATYKSDTIVEDVNSENIYYDVNILLTSYILISWLNIGTNYMIGYARRP